MADFYQIEDQHGYRCPWNVWPQSRLDMMKNGIPLSILYTPTKNIENILRVQYPAVRCMKCSAVLNPYCNIDYAQKQFACAYCQMVQQLPASYKEISEQRKPAELHQAYRTMEYELTQAQIEQRVVIFCVDICVDEEELEKIKASLLLALDILPADTKIGLITFGTTVNVHELEFEICPRKVVLRGTIDFPPQVIEQYLGIKAQTQRFLLPVEQCKDTVTQLIEDLHVDLWNVPEKHRPFRSTGAALSIATSMIHCLQAAAVQQHKSPTAQIALLVSGPCTAGPGQIVDTDIAQHIRHWPDIQNGSEVAKYSKDTVKFYTKLADRACEANCSLNVFSCATDQVGLFELQQMVKQTGGTMMISESFAYQAFQKTWRLYLEQQSSPEALITQQGAVQLSISCSNNVKVQGVVGPVNSAKSQSPQIGTPEIGVGGTDRWTMCQSDSDVTLLYVFDLPDQKDLASHRCVQFRTEYTEQASGKRIMRVTNAAFRVANNEVIQEFQNGFDQEAAACVLARLSVLRFDQVFSTEEVLRNVDRIIIKVSRNLCKFMANDPQSVKFAQNIEFFPQFLYHFRRSDMIQLFGQSPDETTSKHFQLNRQTVSNMLSMLQPALLCYTVQNTEGEPVFLDSQECTQDRILLMDSFFNLLVWSGSTVAAWRNAGYHLMPEYANVKQLIDAPTTEINEILKNRYPSPRFDYADQGTSQARILLARVNPASTHKGGSGQGEIVATDDVSLQQFLDALKKTIVMVEK